MWTNIKIRERLLMSPLMTSAGHHRTVSSVSSSHSPDMPSELMKAVIMVGGPTTDSWFRPLSLQQPKPLFPLAGRPMIWHHIKSLSRFETLKEILVIGFYESSQFSQFIQDAQQEFGIVIKYLQEPKSLGTGGGLCNFQGEILSGHPKYIFIIYGDICCACPFGRMLVALNQAPGTLATILATHVTREQSSNYGCLVKEAGESNVIMHYVEKPETFVSNLVSCGVYLLDTAIFNEFPRLLAYATQQPSTGIRPKIIRLEQDILAPLAAERKVSFYETQDFWCQVKTANSAITANRLYLEDSVFKSSSFQNSNDDFEAVGAIFVHPSAKVAADVMIGPNVSIGENCVIECGVRIRDSIILPGSKIGANTLVVNSIIGWESEIGAWCRIEGAPDSAATDVITLNGVKMPSITVLGGSVFVTDERVIRNCIVLPHKDLYKSYQNEILL